MTRRFIATTLVAAGLGLLVSPGVALILAGVGLGWSGVELPVAVAVRRLRPFSRRKDPRVFSRAPAEGPAAAATG